MTFRIRGLDPAPFAPLFALSDAELAARGAVRRFADAQPGFPCRVSLVDAEIGEELLLLSYEHHAVTSPYRASGPIYIRRAAHSAFDAIDKVPPVLHHRLLSLRAYDAAGMLRDAQVCEGDAVAERIERAFADPAIAYLHVHNAKPGCFSCRVDRS